jgi:cell division protein FtsN
MAGELVEALRVKGFQATAAGGPTEDLFRVLVGPLKDEAALVRAQSDLQAAGFSSFVRRQKTR